MIVGGVIPQQDYQLLRDVGVAGIFGPGTRITAAARYAPSGLPGNAIATPVLAHIQAHQPSLCGRQVRPVWRSRPFPRTLLGHIDLGPIYSSRVPIYAPINIYLGPIYSPQQ